MITATNIVITTKTITTIRTATSNNNTAITVSMLPSNNISIITILLYTGKLFVLLATCSTFLITNNVYFYNI